MVGDGRLPLGLGQNKWLRCHGLELLVRVLEPEYDDAVADRWVSDTEAGCTRDPNAPERFLATRLVEGLHAGAELTLSKGYVDFGIFS